MSLIVKAIIGILVILVIGWAFVAYAPQPAEETGTATQQENAPAPDTAAAITTRGSSDAALDADLKDVDAQLDAAIQGSAAVDGSMNDKAGDVSY